MRPMEDLKARLGRSAFRSRFRLGPREKEYASERGLKQIQEHAVNFVTRRLAPASPSGDGRQTPMKGHPVFIAQHATATCCRKCLQKWHNLPTGKALSQEEITYVVSVIMDWIEKEMKGSRGHEKENQDGQGRQLSLFERETGETSPAS